MIGEEAAGPADEDRAAVRRQRDALRHLAVRATPGGLREQALSLRRADPQDRGGEKRNSDDRPRRRSAAQSVVRRVTEHHVRTSLTLGA